MVDRITQLKTLLDAEPTDAFCMYGLAMEYSRLGQHAAAVEWFDHTLRADANYCYAYFHKAKTLENAGDVSAACETLRAGVKRARDVGDGKALSEISAYLDELE